MFTIEIPNDVENRLELLSLTTGRSMQFFAREAILEYLDNVEDRYTGTNRIAEEDNRGRENYSQNAYEQDEAYDKFLGM